MKASLETEELANAQLILAMPSLPGDPNHVVHLYEDDLGLCVVVADYLTDGLLAGDTAIVVMTEAHRSELRRALTERGVDVASACASGQLVLFDARETLAMITIGATPNWELFEATMRALLEQTLARHAGRKLRVFGEMVDLLLCDGKPRAARRLEEMWIDLLRSHAFSLLCAYSMSRVCDEPGELQRVCATHTRLLPTAPSLRLETVSNLDRARVLLPEIARRKELEGALRSCQTELRAASMRAESLEDELQLAHQRSGLLCALAAAASRAADVGPVCEQAFDALRLAVGAERCAIWTGSRAEQLELRAARGLSEAFTRRARPIFGDAMHRGQPQRIADVGSERALAPHLPWLRAERVAALTTLPLLSGDDCVGLLTLFHARPHSGDTSEFEFASVVADQLAAAINRFSYCAELAQSEQLSSMIAGILRHDVRNQLAPILMGAKMAADRADSEGLLRPLRNVLSSGERMVCMIDQLLDFAHLRTRTGVTLTPVRVDLLGVLREVVGELDDQNPEWLLSLDELGGDTEGTWDADRLNQVFTNLVTNAVEHGHCEHGVQVIVDGREPEVVHVEVQNRGAIRPAVVDKLFEPLTGLARGAGLGLGLHITREIVRAHAGRVDLQSSDDHGTVFRVALPRHALRSNTAQPHEFFAHQ